MDVRSFVQHHQNELTVQGDEVLSPLRCHPEMELCILDTYATK